MSDGILAYLPEDKRRELTKERLALMRAVSEANTLISKLEAENTLLRNVAEAVQAHKNSLDVSIRAGRLPPDPAETVGAIYEALAQWRAAEGKS